MRTRSQPLSTRKLRYARFSYVSNDTLSGRSSLSELKFLHSHAAAKAEKKYEGETRLASISGVKFYYRQNTDTLSPSILIGKRNVVFCRRQVERHGNNILSVAYT
jgi:hypothetical protein